MDSRTTPSKSLLDRIRKQYPEGSRVRLVTMDDPYTDLSPGACGSVGFIDDMGTIFVNWDNGSGLGVVYGTDRIERIDDRNYLRNAELDLEGKEAGYDMIDGIINNIPKAKAEEKEAEAKPSVLDKLTPTAPQERIASKAPRADLEPER
ncbi:MAG: DUF4314 domain-containing protein [Eggerthellaceae bacterium]|nr:DUF4314 domain-containing protein [Eggerthellaceae bacterium]